MATTAKVNRLEEQYTIPNWINEGKTNLIPSRSGLLFKSLNATKDVITPYQALTCKYYDVLTQYVIDYSLDDTQYNLYKCNPKKLSLDLYNTPELWFALLYINGCASSMQFKNKKKIKVFSSSILDALEELTSILEDDISENDNQVYLK